MSFRRSALTCGIGLAGILGAAPGFPSALMVGVRPADGVAMLVKSFPVAGGTTILGARFRNNDSRTVFPEVLLVHGLATSIGEGMILARVTDVSESSAGLAQVTWPQPVVADGSGDYLVAVRMPAGKEKQGPGNGPGLGATAVAEAGGSYLASGANGELTAIGADLSIELLAVGVGKASAAGSSGAGNKPRTFLGGGNPNPFNPSTTIEFGISSTSDVALMLYDVAGRQVRTLVRERLTAGSYQRPWDGRDERGDVVAAGIYVVRLRVGESTFQEKIALVK